MKFHTEISAVAQAAFAGLDVAAHDADVRRSVAELPGGFARKQDKGWRYWYYQRKQADGRVQQIFVGTHDEKTRALIERHDASDAAQGQAVLQNLARAAIALRCSEIPLKHGRVIARLLDHGFF